MCHRAADEAITKYAGVLLGCSRTSDAVDAIVVAAALTHRAAIVTSDPDDLGCLLDAARVLFRPSLMVVCGALGPAVGT